MNLLNSLSYTRQGQGTLVRLTRSKKKIRDDGGWWRRYIRKLLMRFLIQMAYGCI